MRKRSREPSTGAATLHTSLITAAAVLSRLSRWCNCDDCPVANGIGTLREHAQSLTDFLKPATPGDTTTIVPAWPLDPAWHPIVFTMGKDQPKILLTIGINALRALEDVYNEVLDTNWSSPAFDDIVAFQLGAVTTAKHGLERLRRELNHWPDVAEAGLLHIAAR